MLSLSTYSIASFNVDLDKSYNDLSANKRCDWYESLSKTRLVKKSNSYTVFLRRLLESKQGQVNNVGDSGAVINLSDAPKEEHTYGLLSSQMIESERVAMTGSNNPNPENRTWLTNVTTANSREVTRHGTVPCFSASTLHNPDPGPPLCPSGFFRPTAVSMSNPSDPLNQPRRYAMEYQTNFPTVEGNNISSYYRQAPHLAQTYASVYHPRFTSSLTEPTPVVMPGHQNFHIEPYSYLSNLPHSASSHDQLQLPHSLAFLTVTAPKPTSQQASPSYSLYPISDEPKENKSLETTVLLHSSLPLSKQDKQSASSISDTNAKIPQFSKTTQNEQPLPYFVLSKTKEKVKSVKEQSSWFPPYRVPAGKEGSLKHRILRPPPTIDIFQPSVSDIAGAPLSAPPSSCECRNEITSPKQIRFSTPTPTKHEPVNSSSMQTSDTFSTASQHHHPAYFMKGSIIQLANGQLKCVEDLKTCDFVESAESSTDLCVDCSTIIRIEEIPASGLAILGFSVGEKQVQITAEAPLEHPFFIWNQGWSSSSPELSMHRYNLSCCKLKVGDVCISLTRKVKQNSQASSSNLTVANQDSSAKCSSRKSSSQEYSIVCKSPQSHISSQTPNLRCTRKSSSSKRKRKRCSSAPDCISS